MTGDEVVIANRVRRFFMHHCLVVFCAGLITACIQPAVTPAPASIAVPNSSVPAAFPEAGYLQARLQGKTVLQIDTASSLITIAVYRGGSLARLGHDHVIASHDVHGYVLPEEGKADLYLPLDQLTVDEPNLLAGAGFDSHPSQDAIDGTRRNMLTRVLETAQFPSALIHLIRQDANTSVLNADITVHGVSHHVDIPVKIENNAEGMRIKGQLSLNQSDFGMMPLSVLGGALLVQDKVDLRFEISAKKI